ncbi:MAG TPA: carboxymuconolactone decarboxylase family protein [Rhizobacter sp.]|nr:carboxymuconolactone decarboxylase family protein [Rhizobacter sp.]
MTARTARMPPAQPPFPPEIQAAFEKIMPPGMPPLQLFTTLAREPRLFGKFFAAGLLDRGRLTLRQREIVIHRTTALCRSEYEWGVHAALFAERVGLDAAQLASTVSGSPDDACWSEEDRVLLRLCDALHAGCDVDDALWALLRAHFSEEAVLELLMLAGFYRTVSYLTNALRLPPEAAAARFP